MEFGYKAAARLVVSRRYRTIAGRDTMEICLDVRDLDQSLDVAESVLHLRNHRLHNQVLALPLSRLVQLVFAHFLLMLPS